MRDYDPQTGRYVQPDPIGILRDYSDPVLKLSIDLGLINPDGDYTNPIDHLYNYVHNDPIGYFDPEGLAEHSTNKRESNRNKHEAGDARRKKDGGGEKGDEGRSPPRKRPPGHKGPWPLIRGFLIPVLPYDPCVIMPEICNPCAPFNCDDISC